MARSKRNPTLVVPDIAPPPKRVKNTPSVATANRRIRGQLKMLVEMPWDILFEIFSHLEPSDVLHLARTTKALRNVLMSRSAISVWKAAFVNDPDLPGVPDGLNEPQYANLAFSPHCHACFVPGDHTILWAFHERLCARCMEGRFDDGSKVCKKLPGLSQNWHLLRRTSTGYARSFYSYEEAAELNNQILKLKKGDSAKLDEFISQRAAFVDKIQKYVTQAEQAGPLRTARKQRALQEARDRRKAAICGHLCDVGYSGEVEYLESSHPSVLKEHPLILSDEFLTEQAWEAMKPELVKLMQSVTEKMERKRRKTLLKTRQRLLLSVLKDYLLERPIDEVNPRAIDFCIVPRVKAIIEDASKDAYTTEESFETFLAELPQLCEDWRESKTPALLALFPNQPKDGTSVLLKATTFFRCAECTEPIGYPRVLAHACLFELQHGHRNRDEEDEFAQMCVNFGQEPWNMNGRRVAHYPAAAKSAASVVRACGLDTELTTAQDMDDVGAWVECLRCSHKVEGRAVFQWRKAILHDMYHVASGEASQWHLLDEDDAEAAEALQEKTYQSSYCEAQDYVCTRCRQQLSRSQLRGHLRISHNIQDLDPEEDYTLHVDASMHQPPFTLMLPHGLPKVIDLSDDAPTEVIDIDGDEQLEYL